MPQGPGRITLWGIEVFVATAETGSVSGAARRLGAGVSSVSQQLSNLEQALGAALLDRAARPMALTPAGALFLRRAQAMLNEAALARTELMSRDLAGLTRLRLGLIEDFDAEVTPRLLTEMGGGLQDCHFLLETGASHHLLERLETRALDVAVATQNGPAPDGMEVHPLLAEPFVLALPPGPGSDRAELPDLPFIHYTARHMMGRTIEGWLAGQKLALPHRFELDSYHAILALVAAGAGWTIITPLGLHAARRFRDVVEVCPLPGPPVSRTIALHARAGVLADMPARMAQQLRGLLAGLVVGPAVARLPFLAGTLSVLDAGADQVP